MRGSIRQRAEGTWTLIFDVGSDVPDDQGRKRRKQQVVTVRGTRKQAETKLTDLLRAADRQEFVEPARITTAEWLKKWLDNIKGSVRPSTHVRYSSVVNGHMLKSKLAAVPLQRLRASHAEAYYGTIPVGSRPVHHTVLRRALRKAVRDRLLSRNPLEDLERARQRVKAENEDGRANCWTAPEAQQFRDVALKAGPQAAAFYALALDSGARKSELCGLGWPLSRLAFANGLLTKSAVLAGTSRENEQRRSMETRIKND